MPSDSASARLHSVQSRPGNIWLSSPPTIPKYRLHDHEFRDGARMQLGVSQFSSVPNAWTCRCGAIVQGDDVTHAMHCPKTAGLRQKRHDALVDTIQQFERQCGNWSSVECLYRRCGRDRMNLQQNRTQGRGDIHTIRRAATGDTIVDVVMPSPLASQYLPRARGGPGHAADAAEQQKTRAYLADHNCPGYTFRPVAVEVFGRWGSGAMRFARESVDGAGFIGRQRALAFDNFCKAVAFERVRWNSRILTHGVGLSAAATGRNSVPGFSVPSPEWDG